MHEQLVTIKIIIKLIIEWKRFMWTTLLFNYCLFLFTTQIRPSRFASSMWERTIRGENPEPTYYEILSISNPTTKPPPKLYYQIIVTNLQCTTPYRFPYCDLPSACMPANEQQCLMQNIHQSNCHCSSKSLDKVDAATSISYSTLTRVDEGTLVCLCTL